MLDANVGTGAACQKHLNLLSGQRTCKRQCRTAADRCKEYPAYWGSS